MHRILVALAVLLIVGSSAKASGMLIPVEKALPPLALLDHKVTVTIDDQAAITRIDQTFRNHTPRQLEATYLFPVPKGASVRKFSMWVNGKEEPGEVVEADKARKIYTDIVARTQDPGLLEYINQALIKVRVFPVPANGDQRISVTYTSVAVADNGLTEYVYPMKADGRAATLLDKFSLSVAVKSQHSLTNVYSPSHSITIARPNDKEAVIGFEKNQATLDRDFQLYYQAGSKDVGLTAVAHRPVADRPGYFMMLLSPRAELSKSQQAPRDFVYVIDTSGSMRGKRIAQAKNALKYCLKNLDANDRFTMINFASTVNKYTNNLQPATAPNLEAARRWVDDLEATGGTAIDDALRDALGTRSNDEGRTYTMVFFTDGQPTWGERDPKKILENVKKQNTGNTRIFSFGVGDDVNTVLLDALADNTKAISTYVRESEDIEAKVSSLYAKISNPVLTNLKLSVGDGVRISDVFPPQLPDLFHGTQLVVMGRYSGKGTEIVKLTGQIGKVTKEFVYELKFAEKTGDDKNFVEDLWARRKVGYLLDQIRVHGETTEVKDEIIGLAKRYGITTPYTSYLLVPDGPVTPVAAKPVVPGKPDVSFGLDPKVAPIPQALLPAPGGFGEKDKRKGPANPKGTTSVPPPPTTPATVEVFLKTFGQPSKSDATGGPDIVGLGRTKQVSDQLEAESKYTAGDGKDGDKAAKEKSEKAKDALDQRRALLQASDAFREKNLIEVQQGKLGVDFAVQNNLLRFQDRLDNKNTASRLVQKRNVIDVGGIWIDDGFTPKMETVTIKSQSAAYFRMLERRPEVKDVFQLGNYVVWVTPSGKALIIDRGAGLETMNDADIDRLFTAPAKTEKKIEKK
jgi:Ca-activated chloride channel family protein